MRGSLVFEPRSLGELEVVLGRAATALGSPDAPWVTESFERLPDASFDDKAFAQVWTRPGARLLVRATCTEGNPREGWTYDGELTLMLRAERAGPLTSRVYTIGLVCADDAGNGTSAAVTVTVPHDQRSK